MVTDLLTNVPATWGQKRLKFAAHIDTSGVWGDAEDLPTVTTANINRLGRFDLETATVRSFSKEDAEYYKCNPGDIIVVKSSGSATSIITGKCAQATAEDRDFCFGNFTLRARANNDLVDDRFLFYFLVSGITVERIKIMVSTTTYPNLKVGDYIGHEVPLPPLDTQRWIARFLDEKTARIDALIEKKRALLDRLAEKRQALITRAVTKGLNPDAPMKPSGIDWLGDIPAHWEVLPLKRIVQYQEGPGILAVDFRDEGVPLLRVASIGGRYATLEGVNYLDTDMVKGKWGHFLTQVGDLLISASATSGIVSEVTDETSGCVPYTGIIRVNPIDGEADSPFIRHLLVSDVFLSQIEQLKAGTTIQHFGPYHLGLMVIAKPPLHEQRAIGNELDQRLRSHDYNEVLVRKSIEFLSEYRAALITAAVTGELAELR